jgi:outer membrane protein assembly factor BamB
MSIVFSSVDRGIVVTLDADGSPSWSGRYKGAPIKQAIPIDYGRLCILLIDPDVNQAPVFENLFCIDVSGNPVWIAKVPSSPDVFLEIIMGDDGLLAKSWSGFSVLLNKDTGSEIKRNFSK